MMACVLAGFASAAVAAKTYSDNGDGTVTDPTTGLQWIRCSMGQTWDGTTCTGTASNHSWDQANVLTSTVAFAGQSDWRLPNIRELTTIVDRSILGPAIDRIAFPNTTSSDFWSASAYANDSSRAWHVEFGYGNAFHINKSAAYQVRLVRAGQSFGSLMGITRPTSDYVDHGNGTVTHTPTALMWKRCAEGQAWSGSTCTGTASAHTFAQANALTGTSTFAGQSDWRLPTEDELVSLVDYSIYLPTINTSIFPATPASSFWSTSTYAYSASDAWYVYFGDGNAAAGQRSGAVQVRLVRSGQSFGSFILNVSKSGTGTGTVTSAPAGISCGATCNASFTSGSSVTLTAAPGSGNSFSGWSGACSGIASTCTVTLNSAMNVTSSFTATGSTLLTRYRLYSETTKEHLYTTDLNEYNTLPVCCAWKAEGSIYRLFQGAGSVAGISAVPYYRLYNPYSYQHHWTTDFNEYNTLGAQGWKQEGIDGYVLPSQATGSIQLYRLYLNAYGGLHLWTTDANEKNVLTTSQGWKDEGFAGYVMPMQ
jgi:hypothetical protein